MSPCARWPKSSAAKPLPNLKNTPTPTTVDAPNGSFVSRLAKSAFVHDAGKNDTHLSAHDCCAPLLRRVATWPRRLLLGSLVYCPSRQSTSICSTAHSRDRTYEQRAASTATNLEQAAARQSPSLPASPVARPSCPIVAGRPTLPCLRIRPAGESCTAWTCRICTCKARGSTGRWRERGRGGKV